MQAQALLKERNLYRIQSGASSFEIASQVAIVERLERELKQRSVEYERFERLFHQGVISRAEGDAVCLARESATSRLREAVAARDRVAEIRPADVAVAQAEVRSALAELQKARTNYDSAFVRSPIVGKILEIRAHPGERIAEHGVVEIGRTGKMIALAEVYETDVPQLRLGQAAIVTLPALTRPLTGALKWQTLFNVDLDLAIGEIIILTGTLRLRQDDLTHTHWSVANGSKRECARIWN